MDNSKLIMDAVEPHEDRRLSSLQERKGEIALLIETINRLEANEDWKKLKELIFDKTVERFERELSEEVRRIPLDPPKIYRLQGIIEWAKKYANLQLLLGQKKQEKESINNILNNESNPSDGAL